MLTSAGLLLLLSRADPVAVVAVLKELGAPPRLAMLVEGESLLNDGSAVMLFLIFLRLVEDPSQDHADLTWLDMSHDFTYLAGGALLWGLTTGYCTYLWICMFDDATVDITTLILGVFITFYVAEHMMHVSGILALVAISIRIDEFCVQNDGFCIQNDEFCNINDASLRPGGVRPIPRAEQELHDVQGGD